MKRFLACFILFVFIFEYFGFGNFVFAANNNFKSDFVKYNLSDEEMDFVGKATWNYSGNIKVTEELIQKGLLRDFMNTERKYGQWDIEMEILMFIKGKTDNFSKNRMDRLKRISKYYFIKIDDKCYMGISKVKADKIQPNCKIYMSREDNYSLKRLKIRDEFENKYNLSKDEKTWLERDTNYYKNNISFVKQILDDGYYDDYCKYCHIYGVTGDSGVLKKQYKIMRRLMNAGSFTDDEIKQLSYTRRNSDIIQLDNEYYMNINKVSDEILKSAKQHKYYDKGFYKNIRKLKQYNKFQKENNLDDKEMVKIWCDTTRLNKNVKLVKQGMQNGSYKDYYNYKKGSGKHFKDNYKTYLLLKQSNSLTDKEKKDIINKYGTPCVSLNPTYWGNKTKKVKNTLKSKRIDEKDKYSVIDKRISYRRPYADEWLNDIAARLIIGGLILSGIGFVGGIMAWAAYSDSGCKFIKLKF